MRLDARGLKGNCMIVARQCFWQPAQPSQRYATTVEGIGELRTQGDSTLVSVDGILVTTHLLQQMAAVDVGFNIIAFERDRPLVVGQRIFKTPEVPQHRGAVEVRNVIPLVQSESLAVALQCLVPTT